MNTKKTLRSFYMGAEPYLFAPMNALLRSNVVRIGRSLIAQKYLAGSGLEIGAHASPTLVPLGVNVTYVDRVPASYWRDDPQYQGIKLVDPNIIDDGSVLAMIPDNSVDFVVSFHMLEHVPNPMGAVKNWIRVTKPGGILVISIPDKRFTEDSVRQLTSIGHFVRDFEQGPEWSAEDHYRDVGGNVMALTGTELEQYVTSAPPAIHFHVWDLSSFFLFIHNTNSYFGEPFDILQVERNQHEVISVLRKK